MAQIGNIHEIFKNAGLEKLGAELPASAAGAAAGLEKAGFAAKVGSAKASESFGNIMDKLVHEVDAKLNSSQVEQQKVMTGEAQNLHQAMISMQEASVSFSLMVEVRNKLVESYQELMRMQI